MIHSFDPIDHIIPWSLLASIIVFFVIYKTIYKKTDDDGQTCLAIICVLTFIGIISFELGNVIGFYGPSDATTHFKSHLVTTSDYRTVYKNNQNITITADHDTDFKSVALSAFMHDTYTTEDKIDKNLTKSNNFTFTKNGVTKTERRATELIVVKNSPLKEESDISRRHIERIEFTTVDNTKSNHMWCVGCFYGTGQELIEKAYADSETSGQNYEHYVNFVEGK